MKKTKWVKQLTRENSLLDRSLRTIAYAKSVAELGKAKIAKSPIIGHGRITSLYYDPVDFKKNQKIILKEFQGNHITRIGNSIVSYLEQGYRWAKQQKGKKFSKKQAMDYLSSFNKHHAHARGAIVYGYWGSPAITVKLKRILAKKLREEEIDNTIHLLSTPKAVTGQLSELYHVSSGLHEKRKKCIGDMRLAGKSLELAEILSWFTFFYEAGELVASFLYHELLEVLKTQVNGKRMFEEIQWYDPESLVSYLKGKPLPDEELQRRKICYILEMAGKKLKVTSGEKAKIRFEKEFEEKLPEKNITTIKGTTACKGKAKGIVRIVISQADQGKMSRGDILVSTMTTPNLMAGIKLAAAIVTDEGGVTAHAAIVARELNIPCIIGTKIATKVLKDGCLVEVNADTGIVTILS